VEEDFMGSKGFSIRGIFTALVTPFSKDGSQVDYESLSRLLDLQKAGGVSGVVVCGSTGEAATLSDGEYREVVRFVRERTKSAMPCVSGISVSATAKAVELAKFSEEVGCDGVLVATPPYNKPSQLGIVEHFRALHRATSLPLIAYNIPGRSGVSVTPTTLGQLSREGLICGIKESSGSIDAVADTLACVRAECEVVSGDDSLALAVLAYGGVGAISAAANALPSEMSSLVKFWEKGDAAGARRVQLDLLPKIRALFIESNPVPVKAVLAMRGEIAHPTVRLPLAPLSESSLVNVKSAFGL
jgi:4-hydroxy-tetrahydrodipicolinate synthase